MSFLTIAKTVPVRYPLVQKFSMYHETSTERLSFIVHNTITVRKCTNYTNFESLEKAFINVC